MARGVIGNPRGELDDERARWSFGRLLGWHLLRGTRPNGNIHRPGRKWSNKAFAEEIGLADRTIRYWLNDQHLPPETETVERVLFGDTDCYADWRLELRHAHSKRLTAETDVWPAEPGPERLAVAGQPAIAAGLPSPGTISNIPQGLVPRHFMGREDALATVSMALQRYKGPTAIVAALHGLRGIGKTVLAAAYAEFHRDDYRVTWWLRAQTQSSLTGDLLALGERLGWIGADEPAEAALAAVIGCLRRDGEGVLLIYDNAIDAAGVKPYLPNGGSAHVLITSNAQAWRGVAEPVAIQLWSKSVGADYLIARTGRVDERLAAKELSEILGGLPLAHEQAGAYCESVDIPLAEYVRRFAAAPARMLDAERYAPAEYHDRLTVTKTFALAIDMAARLHPAAEPLIVHAALLPPEPIPLFLFRDGGEKLDHPFASMLAGDGLDEAIAALRAFGLIDRELVDDEPDPAASTDTIRLHRLVREIAADRRQGDAQAAARGTLIEFVAAVYPRDSFHSPKSWAQARHLDSLALALVGGDIEIPAGAEASASHLLDRLGLYRQSAFGARAQPRAQTLFERALAIREKALGADHLDTAISLINLAALLRTQGNLAAARQLYERALAIRERALGPDHPDTTALLDDVAGLLRAQGDLASARPLYKRALARSESVAGLDHLETAKCLASLADLARTQGDLSDAQSLYQRALAINEKQLGPYHQDTMTALNNLARVRWFQGDFPEARSLFQRAVAIRERLLGDSNSDTAIDLNSLAALIEVQGDLVGARLLYERAVVVAEKLRGPDLLTANTLSNLGRLLRAQGDPAGARPLYERALAISERLRGPGHLDTATSLSNLARLRWDLGDLTGARRFYERALATRERLLGVNNRDTAGSLNSLVGLVQAQGDFSGAERLYWRTLMTGPRHRALDHINGKDNLSHLAGPIEVSRDLGSARPLYERALAISERMRRPNGLNTVGSADVRSFIKEAYRGPDEGILEDWEGRFGPDRVDMATGVGDSARLLQAQGDLAGARHLYERALEINERELSPDDLNTATSLGNLAQLLQVQGDLAAARPLFQRALAITERALGHDHLDTAGRLRNLAGLFQAQNDLVGARRLYERALRITERALGPAHLDTACGLSRLAGLLQAQGDMPAARQLYEHALAIIEEALGPDDLAVLEQLTVLAGMLRAHGDFADAESLYQRAVAISEAQLGPDHLGAAVSLTNLAGLLQAQGDFAGASPLYQRALTITESLLGADYPDTVTLRISLAALIE